MASPTTAPTTRPAPPTALVYDDLSTQHLTGEGHPESPERCAAVMGALAKAEFAPRLLRLKARAATDEEITACHAPAYVELVKRAVADGDRYLPTGDTVISPRSLDAARHAAGGVLAAVDAVIEGRASNAFCVGRPPGHHATPDKGMGFCVFNHVAVAARYAQRRHKVGRVLIVDWDVHHGNGTQDVFYRDDTVFFFSTHQSPWYPGTGRAEETGEDRGRGFTLNCPFRAGAGRREVVGEAFEGRLLPAMRKFKPELVLVSAGFDSREDDPLGRFRLTDGDFAELTRLMLSVAREYAGGRLVSVLEGGYNLEGLASAAASHLGALVSRA